MTSPDSRGGRILVVDDDRHIREALSQVLVDEGYDVTMADNGQAALSALRHPDAFDVMLLDLMMPVMSGWELIERLEEAGPDLPEVPIIVISAFPAPIARRGRRGGVRRWLAKPVGVQLLLDAIDTCRTDEGTGRAGDA